MNCDNVQALLHAYLDNELDEITAWKIKHHLTQCTRCASESEQLQSLQKALHMDGLYASATSDLRRRVQIAVSESGKTTPAPTRKIRYRLRVAVVLLVLPFLCLLILLPILSQASHGTPLPQAVLASDQQALQSNHLVDVASSNQQSLREWFKARLTYTPPAVDFTEQGFSLLGGRLASLNGMSVAVLVYQHETSIMSLFLWPAPGVASPELQTLQGYHLCSWTQSGRTYWAVSTIDAVDMQTFVHLVQQAS
jgi:anti-sigma factor RsiW